MTKKIIDIDLLDCKDITSVLSIVIDLYKESWSNLKKWNENYRTIEQILNKLHSVYPNDVRVLTNLGAIFSDNGKYEDALTELLKAEKLGSKDANLYRNIGIVKMNICSERNNAKQYFAKAHKLNADKLTIEAYFDPQGY